MGLGFDDGRTIRRRGMKTFRASLDAFSQFVEPLRFGKDHIRKCLVGRELLKISAAKTLDELAIISAADEGTATDDGQFPFVSELNRLRETMKSRVTLVFDRAVSLRRFRVRPPAVWIAKLYVFGRVLKRVAN